jgi:2-haloacid dehalogenase
MKPKYISFDCYGTLTHFQMDRAITERFGERLPDEKREDFLQTCEAYRLDEVLGPYRPYREVIARATSRAARRYEIDYRDEDGDFLYERVPTWGPHPGVSAVLGELARQYDLVILSNAADEQIGRNVKLLEAPFYAVFTAEQARAYKPRLSAFEYMLDKLGCGPADIVHVSSSPVYDLRPAYDLGLVHTILLDRGYEPSQPWLGYAEVTDIGALPALVDDLASGRVRR